MKNEFDDTQTGDGEESLSVEQAANAFVKANADGAAHGQPDAQQSDAGENADEERPETEDDETLSEEDEGETEDGDPDDEDGQSDDQDDDEQPETEGGRFVANDGRVRLPDGSIATVSDLIQGNLRDRDYRQKTMGLADEKRQFEEQSSAFEASRKEVEQQRDYMAQLLQAIVPPPPDPKMADPSSPDFDLVAYQHQKVQHEQWAQHLVNLQNQQLQSQQEAERQRQHDSRVKSDQEWSKLQEIVPELKDAAKHDKFVADIVGAGKANGFTQEELSQQLPYDHRQIVVLRKAMLWDRLQASKPKAKQKVRGRPPIQKGGKRLNPNARNAKTAQDAMTRLNQSGSVEDAAAAYIASLNKG